jgi:hypothetical protein
MRYALLYLLVCAGIARADLVGLPTINPGTLTANTDSTTDSNQANPIGTLFSDTGVQTFDFTGSGVETTGSLREAVYQEASGTLDFLIQLNVSAGSVIAVDTGNFAGFNTRVGTLSPVSLLGFGPGSLAPLLDFRSFGGDTVGWIFGNPLTPGVESFTLAISTNATADAMSNVGLIGSDGGTQTLLAFQPTVVAEPSFYVLLFGAVAGVFWHERRRRRLAN